MGHRLLLVLVPLALSSVGHSINAQPSILSLDMAAITREIGHVHVKVESSRVVGVAIDRPGTLLEAVGVEPGDVVVQVNAERLADVRALERFFVLLSDAQAFELVVRSHTGELRTVRCTSRATGCTGR